jgi:hypothetical protein
VGTRFVASALVDPLPPALLGCGRARPRARRGGLMVPPLSTRCAVITVDSSALASGC